MTTRARVILKEVFVYDEFRPLQREIMDHILQKLGHARRYVDRWGKLLCYQIPALQEILAQNADANLTVAARNA